MGIPLVGTNTFMQDIVGTTHKISTWIVANTIPISLFRCIAIYILKLWLRQFAMIYLRIRNSSVAFEYSIFVVGEFHWIFHNTITLSAGTNVANGAMWTELNMKPDDRQLEKDIRKNDWLM